MNYKTLLDSHDSTENKTLAIEKILTEQHSLIHRLTSIINELPGSIYWKNKEGVYLGHNAFASEKMKSINLSWNSIIGKTDYELFSREVADQYRKHDLEVMNQGSVSPKEEVIILPTGEILTQLSIKRPLRDEENNIVGIMGNTIDITYTKKIENQLRDEKEKAEKANLYKTEMVRHMEHDIRTPFGGIWVLANMLETQETDKNKKQCLSDISISAKELLDYCNSILEFIKTEAIVNPIMEKKFDIKQLLNSVIAIEKVAAKSKALELELNISNKIPKMVIGDPMRIFQILLNLISNSIKFTEVGFVKLTIKVVKRIEQHIIINLIIEDSGIGMSPEKQNHFYERTTHIDSLEFIRYNAHGLGLPIVKRLLKDLQGKIEVKSEVGKGSKFICTLALGIPLAS